MSMLRKSSRVWIGSELDCVADRQYMLFGMYQDVPLPNLYSDATYGYLHLLSDVHTSVRVNVMFPPKQLRHRQIKKTAN